MKINPIHHHKLNNINFKSFSIYFCDNVPEPDEFVQSSDDIDFIKLKNLNISHFRLVDSKSVRGATLANHNPIILKEIKNSGIDKVIDLRSESNDTSKYAEACRQNGLDYINFKLNLNMPVFNPPFADKLPPQERKENIHSFIQKLPYFFKLMECGKYYMACCLGLHRTDLAVTMNYLANPKEPSAPPVLSHIYLDGEENYTNKYIAAIKNLIRNLSKKDKKFLDLPDNFNKNFHSRIAKLRAVNLVK